MKYINTFEKFGDFFINKKEIEPLVIDEEIPIDESLVVLDEWYSNQKINYSRP